MSKLKRKEVERMEYLSSDEWRTHRMWAMARADNKCEVCGTNEKMLHVHHKTYKRFGNEHPQDLVVLCEDCHNEAHKKDDNSNMESMTTIQDDTGPVCKKQKVYKKRVSLSTYTQIELLLGKNYTFSQKRAVKAALQDISSTRKTGRISESRKIKILEELAQYPPEIVEVACDYYVSKNCAMDGKKERYLFAIIRNQTKQKEINDEREIASRRAAAVEIDKEKFWKDKHRVYSREDMERWRAELVQAWEENRPTNPQKESRVNRCMHDRPGWDWK